MVGEHCQLVNRWDCQCIESAAALPVGWRHCCRALSACIAESSSLPAPPPPAASTCDQRHWPGQASHGRGSRPGEQGLSRKVEAAAAAATAAAAAAAARQGRGGVGGRVGGDHSRRMLGSSTPPSNVPCPSSSAGTSGSGSGRSLLVARGLGSSSNDPELSRSMSSDVVGRRHMVQPHGPFSAMSSSVASPTNHTATPPTSQPGCAKAARRTAWSPASAITATTSGPATATKASSVRAVLPPAASPSGLRRGRCSLTIWSVC